MKVFSTSKELRDALADTRGIRGLVPTMGALHEGHKSLVTRCREECDTVVVSIFVNPTQFNDPLDLKNYPRDVEADLRLLEDAGANFVYIPEVEDIYPEPDTRVFDFGQVGRVMEGAHRPGHFNGVAQVVTRLFDIVQCDRAYFGEKDFQQVAVIRRMVAQQGYGIGIVECPIIREPDGLALSSRNLLLTPQHHAAASLIYKALREAAGAKGTMSVAGLHDRVVNEINGNPLLEVEYFSIVNAETLEEISAWSDAETVRGCIAVRAGKIRLIDNIELST